MTNRIKSPNQKGHGFIYVLIAVVLVGVAVVAYIILNHQHKEAEAVKDSMEPVSMTVTATDSGIQLRSTTPNPDAKNVNLFEDFSCPHCAELAEATDADMRKQIEAGALNVTIHPLNFLDGKVHHSSLAGSATLALAKEGNAEAYWNFRKMLFEKQREIYNEWKADDFANAAKDMGASSATVKAIKDGSDLDAFRAMAAQDAKTLQGIAGGVSSPVVTTDDKVVDIFKADNTGFRQWPNEVVDGTMVFEKPRARQAPGEATDGAATK